MIDKHSHIPIYLQIEQILLEQIRKGFLSVGDAIPSETYLAEQYQVSRMTARKAVDYLVRQGVVERKRGVGTFIREQRSDLNISLPLDTHLTSSEVATSIELSITNKLLHLEKVLASKELATLLDIEENTPVWYMKRLRLIKDIPFVFESSYMISTPFFEDMSENDLVASKYQYIEKKGQSVSGSLKQVRAELPSEEVRKALGLKRDEAVLCTKNISSLASGIKFEVSEIYYNQQHYTFTLNAKRSRIQS